MTEAPRERRHTKIWVRMGGSWMSTKIGSQQQQSRGQYRRREDKYLCIEIKPDPPLPRVNPNPPTHTRTARSQPPAAHHRRHSRPHHRRHGEHNPTARQPHSDDICSLPKEGTGITWCPPPVMPVERRSPPHRYCRAKGLTDMYMYIDIDIDIDR